MSRPLIAFALSLGFAACSPQPTQTAAEETTAPMEAADAGCSARTRAPWTLPDGGALDIEAVSFGVTCANAVAVLTIRQPQGAVLWTAAYPTALVATLKEAPDSAGMSKSLSQWLQSGSQTSADLPEWSSGATSPVSGEFPFYPDDSLDTAAYAALRERAAPMFCHVQGMESQLCLVLENGVISRAGVQTFPG
jgi:hypothetical protein